MSVHFASGEIDRCIKGGKRGIQVKCTEWWIMLDLKVQHKAEGVFMVECIGFTMRSLSIQHVNSESVQRRGIQNLIVSDCGIWLHLSLLGGSGGWM